MAGSTYPHDPRDPALRPCVRCGDRYMPPSFCDEHERTCRTCCSRLGLRCGLRLPTNPVDFVFRILQRDMRTAAMLYRPCLDLWCRWVRDHQRTAKAEAADTYRAAVQADVDALYGPEGDR